MKSNTRSYNSRLNTSLSQFVPDGTQIFLDFIVSILLLATLNARAIWHFFTTGITADSQLDLGSLISEKAPAIEGVLGNLAHGRFIQVLFWLFVGCIVYILIWIVGNFFTNIRNDIVADEYLHPTSYKRAGYWGSIFSRKIFFVSILVILAAYIYSGLKLVATLADLTYLAFKDFEIVLSSLKLVGYLVTTAILVQIFFVLTGIATKTWKLIYKDL
ncbi:hypothetical protein H0X09_00735 [Candidatus Saccharibacteria bacterium]|nr:hypothetical protein [Candidatus Saccharibacteria bacterium]